MIKVKLFISQKAAELELWINAFLKDMQAVEIIDVKFTTNISDDGAWYNALILYRMK